MDINQENINAPDKIRVAVNNNNFYFNTRTTVVLVPDGN
jgi:hypothetical protein